MRLNLPALPVLSLLLACASIFAGDAADGPITYKGDITCKTFPGMEKFNCNTTVAFEGERLYVGSHYGSGICCFKRDPKTGEATKFLGLLDIGAEAEKPGAHMDCCMAVANGYLYTTALMTHNGPCLGLFWFKLGDVDALPKLAGKQKCDAGSLALSPDKKTMYLHGRDAGSIEWFKFGSDGAPVSAGKITGKGLAGGGTPSADGQFVYTLSQKDQAVGCAKIKPDGSLEYVGAYDYAAGLKPTGGMRTTTLALSPDGRDAYVMLWTYNFNAVGRFNRDAKTGALEFKETIEADKNMYGMDGCIFAPDGKTAYYSSCSENPGACIGWLTRDPASGKLAYGGFVKQTKGLNYCGMIYAADTGSLYAPTWRIGDSRLTICSVKP